MDPITGLQDPADGLQHPEDDLGADDLPQADNPDVDVDDDDVPDPDAMAALFPQEGQGKDHDAQGAGNDAPPAAGGNNRPDEGDWDKLSDDDKRRGFMRQADYTKKTQALSAERRELEELRQKLLGIQQDLLTKQQAPPPAQQQPPQQLPKLDFAECVDEDGLLDLNKLRDVIQQREEALEERIRSQYVNPLDQKLTAREQQEQEAELEREIGRLRKQHEQMQAAFPHYRDEAVQRRVAEYMKDNNVRSFHAAYVALYPEEHARAYLRYEQAKAKSKQPNGAPPPQTPPNRQSQAREPIPDDDAEFEDQMARKLAKLTGQTLRD